MICVKLAKEKPRQPKLTGSPMLVNHANEKWSTSLICLTLGLEKMICVKFAKEKPRQPKLTGLTQAIHFAK